MALSRPKPDTIPHASDSRNPSSFPGHRIGQVDYPSRSSSSRSACAVSCPRQLVTPSQVGLIISAYLATCSLQVDSSLRAMRSRSELCQAWLTERDQHLEAVLSRTLGSQVTRQYQENPKTVNLQYIL